MNKFIAIILFNVVFMTNFLHGFTADQIKVTCSSTSDPSSSAGACTSSDCALVTPETLQSAENEDQFSRICSACTPWFKGRLSRKNLTKDEFALYTSLIGTCNHCNYVTFDTFYSANDKAKICNTCGSWFTVKKNEAIKIDQADNVSPTDRKNAQNNITKYGSLEDACNLYLQGDF